MSDLGTSVALRNVDERATGIAPEALDMLRFVGSTWGLAPPVDGYTGPLPGILAEIDRLIGRRLTLEFAKEFGGRRMAFPKRLQPRGRVVAAIGEEAAKKLHAVYGDGLKMDIPLGPLSYEWMRIMAIRSLICTGKYSASEIASYFRVTERTVINHRSTLAQFGVLPRRLDKVRPDISARLGAVSLLLENGTAPIEVVRQLDVPLAEVERQTATRRKNLAARGATE